MTARAAAALAWLLGGALAAAPAAAASPPIEQHGYTRLSTPAEITADLEALAISPRARVELLGASVQARPLAALVLEPLLADPEHPPLTVMIVGSQHGAAEAAGTETLIALAHELAAEPNGERRRTIRYVLVPDANPDGRALRRRANANGVNLNTDYVLLSQPESRALLGAVQRFRPDVILDVHESAVLKRESLAREGYLTDFDAQFDVANNPALSPDVASFAAQTLLPAIIARVDAAGLPAQRYLAEIRSTHQALTNGGLTLRNLRNRAAIGGAASFLLETRLDPQHGSYPTWRNIAARVARQRLCITAFLAVIREHAADIRQRTRVARSRTPRGRLLLDAHYAADDAHPRVRIGLRRLADGSAVALDFPDHRHIDGTVRLTRPTAYVVTDHIGVIRAMLDRQGIASRPFAASERATVLALELGPRRAGAPTVRRTERRALTVPVGSLFVDLAQPEGLALPLLLDPRSTSSVFREPGFGSLLTPDREFFVYAAFRTNTGDPSR